MKCAICEAICVCRKAPPGICCDCHKHKVQRGMNRELVDQWRALHNYPPIPDGQWDRQFERPARRKAAQLLREGASGQT